MLAFKLTTEAEPARVKIRAAQAERKLPRGEPDTIAAEAFTGGFITANEKVQLEQAHAACMAAIEVDVFTPEEYYGSGELQSMTATGNGGYTH